MANEDDYLSMNSRKDLITFFDQRDNNVNQLIISKVPDLCKNEPCQLGIDEAGRGPVMGAMVYGISYAPLSQKQILVDLGCADSKSLTEEKRDIIFEKILEERDKMGWAIEAISPNIISNSMYRRSKISLNEVSMNSAIGLIQRVIKAGVNVSEIYVDTVGPPEKYQAQLQKIFPDYKIVVAKKADSTYPIVSAASICAKVCRDHALRTWRFREGNMETEYGSGYPNDPVTKTWLTTNVNKVFGFPQIIRFSWSTAEKVLESHALEVEWEDIEETEASTQKISKYFAQTPPKSVKTKAKHQFFTEKQLSNLTSL